MTEEVLEQADVVLEKVTIYFHD